MMPRMVAAIFLAIGFFAPEAVPAQGVRSLCEGGTKVAAFDFENGAFPADTIWSAYRAQVPATIVNERGNNFLRITAKPGDHLWTTAPIVRSQTTAGGSSFKEGDIVAYSLSIRLGDNAPQGSIWWELFQYGGDAGTGPSIWLWGRDDGTVILRNYFNQTGPPGPDTREWREMNLGRIPTRRFVDISVMVVWSLDPALGTIEVWLDGKAAGTMRGVPTILSRFSDLSAEMHIGTYGRGGAGTVDFDNLRITNCSRIADPRVR